MLKHRYESRGKGNCGVGSDIPGEAEDVQHRAGKAGATRGEAQSAPQAGRPIEGFLMKDMPGDAEGPRWPCGCLGAPGGGSRASGGGSARELPGENFSLLLQGWAVHSPCSNPPPTPSPHINVPRWTRRLSALADQDTGELAPSYWAAPAALTSGPGSRPKASLP